MKLVVCVKNVKTIHLVNKYKDNSVRTKRDILEWRVRLVPCWYQNIFHVNSLQYKIKQNTAKNPFLDRKKKMISDEFF